MENPRIENLINALGAIRVDDLANVEHLVTIHQLKVSLESSVPIEVIHVGGYAFEKHKIQKCVNKIQAIKLVREVTRMGLGDAKKFVEERPDVFGSFPTIRI